MDTVSGRPVGGAWVRLLTGPQRSYDVVDDTVPELAIAVRPEYIGLGIGTRLLAALLGAARPVYPSIVLSVRDDNPASSPDDLAGQRIGAIAGSTNMALTETFPGVVAVPFAGTEDVFGDMIRALRDGAIDGFVDDDVVMVPLAEEPDLRLAFTIRTGNRWGALPRGDDVLRPALDEAIDACVADGSLGAVWARWIPWLRFPLGPR